jgi:hypothetical protein
MPMEMEFLITRKKTPMATGFQIILMKMMIMMEFLTVKMMTLTEMEFQIA